MLRPAGYIISQFGCTSHSRPTCLVCAIGKSTYKNFWNNALVLAAESAAKGCHKYML